MALVRSGMHCRQHQRVEDLVHAFGGMGHGVSQPPVEQPNQGARHVVGENRRRHRPLPRRWPFGCKSLLQPPGEMGSHHPLERFEPARGGEGAAERAEFLDVREELPRRGGWGQSSFMVLSTGMARSLRLEFPGGLYHVIARGNERKAIFRDDTDRKKYLELIARYREKFGCQFLAYCLMDNHVHLAIETGKPPLSKIMAGLQSTYTQYFNWRHSRVGHLFQGRYKAFLVEKDPYAFALLRYIHENPVKAKVVERPEQYAWSSDRFYRRGKGPGWLDSDRLLRMLGRSRAAAIRAYRRLMREKVEEPYEEVPSWGGAVKGDEGFADRVLQEAGEPPVVPKGLTVEGIARSVAERQGVDLARLRGPRRDREASRARLMTAWLAREVGRISAAESARFFGREASTMVNGLNRLDNVMKADQALRRAVGEMREKLTGTHNTKRED